MIITQRATSIESNTTGLDLKYTIENPAIIMQTLVNLYSNPLKTIPQEYMANARDAHREIDSDEPIIVTLPDSFTPFLSIRDFGPSLDPERIEKVFVVLGKTTKNNIKENGGYGIGAKSAFAIADAFTVKSYTNGIGRIYNIYRDEAFEPHLTQMSEFETTERNGVEVVIPIKENDFSTVAINVGEIRSYWKETVIVKNDIHGYANPKVIEYSATRDNWGFVKNTNTYNSTKICSGGTPHVIVDGVKYPIDSKIMKARVDECMHFLFDLDIHIFAEVVDYIPAPNRESLRYDQNTIDKISQTFSSIYEYIMDSFEATISNCENGLDIGSCLQKFNDSFYISKSIKKYMYRDYEIPYKGVNLRDHGLLVYTVTNNSMSLDSSDDKILYEHPLIINDELTKKPSIPRLRTYFRDNPNIDTVQIVAFDNFRNAGSVESLYNRPSIQNLFSDLIRVFDAVKLTNYKKTNGMGSGSKTTATKGVFDAKYLLNYGGSKISPMTLDSSRHQDIVKYVLFHTDRLGKSNKLVVVWGGQSIYVHDLRNFMDVCIDSGSELYFVPNRFKSKFMKAFPNCTIVDEDFVKAKTIEKIGTYDDTINKMKNNVVQNCKNEHVGYFEKVKEYLGVDYRTEFSEFMDGHIIDCGEYGNHISLYKKFCNVAFGKDVRFDKDKYEELVKTYVANFAKEKTGSLYTIFDKMGQHNLYRMLGECKDVCLELLPKNNS